MPKLVITEEGGAREVVIRSGDTAGRVSENAIRLSVPEASRRHCKFFEEKGVWFVEDLGSSNGTLVNGRRVSRFELADGDVIQVGLAEMRFLDAGEVVEAVPEKAWGEDDLSLDDEIFLVIGGTKRTGEVVKLPEGKTTVGRNAKHALRLQDASVSGDHAEIVRDGDRVTLLDAGSKNGTFLNGRRIDRSELHSGDEVRFGSIPCTFGVGDPDDFAPPAAIDEAGDAEFTRAMEMGDFDEDATFDLSGAPARKDTVFNIIAAVMIALLGFGVWQLSRHKPKQTIDEGGRSRTANLLPEFAWSFELPDDTAESETESLMWDRLRADGAAEIELVSAPVLSGSFALAVERRGGGPDRALAVLPRAFQVSSGSGYRVVVSARSSGAVPVAGMAWYGEAITAEGEKHEIELGTGLVYGVPGDGAFREISGLLIVPEEAVRGRFVVGVATDGRAVFDDAFLNTEVVPESRVATAAGCRASLSPQGSFSLARYGRPILAGAGLAAMAEEGGPVLHDEIVLSGPPSEGRLSGTLRGGGGDVAISLAAGENRIRYQIEGPGVQEVKALALPLYAGVESGFQVTTINGEFGVRHESAFEATEVDALVVGVGRDRVRLAVSTPEASPAGFRARCVAAGGSAPLVLIEVPGVSSLRLEFQLSFDAEEKAARSLLAEAREAERKQESGKAILLLEQVRARYPFEESIEKDAASLLSRLQDDARRRIDGLSERLQNAEFFRTLLSEEKTLKDDLEREAARYRDTPFAEALDALEARRAQIVEGWLAAARQAAAERDLIRASDYIEAERFQLARYFLESIVREHPGSDEADLAESRLQRIKQLSEERKGR